MKTSLLITLSKIITLLCKLFKKNGSVYPASIILPLDRSVLNKIKYPKYVIGVTGSSGKGSTTSLIAHILEDNNYHVVWNKSGSNVVNGITTLILNNTNILTHRVKCDCLLLEMDEAYIKKAFKKSTLTHLVVTNITRDQVARNGAPELVLDKIQAAINDSMHLILNADDVLVNRLAIAHQGAITTYGIAKNKYSLEKPISHNLDGAYCPICEHKLKYSYYHYGHLGSYKCSNCNYQRKVTYEAREIDLKKASMKINKQQFKLTKNIFFAAYSTLAAYTLCKTIGLTSEELIKSLNYNNRQIKGMQSLKLGTREVIMLESKNENSLSYYQSLTYINEYPEQKTIILGFDNVSRRYKYNDISWLYDIDFEILDIAKIDRIFAIGRFKFDVATRLINAGIPESKIVLVHDMNYIKDILEENSSGTIFTMVCFDMTTILKEIFTRGDSNEN